MTTTRELKYVIFGEDQLSAKMQKISAASDRTTRSLGNHTAQLGGLKSKMAETNRLSSVFESSMGSAGARVAGLAGPIGIGAAAIAGIGIVLNKGIDEASAFELEFRKLNNINLDKTKAQVDDLRDRILGLSYAGGFDPTKFSQGVFDIQSLTGDSGRMSEAIVKAQYEFARASGADANQYISGTGTAMKNFGFGAEGIEGYNKSMMGVIATSKLTYEELAKVSALYAGPAAAAHQSVNTANKVMSLFKATTNSAEESATKTKVAFTDLFKKSTADSFKAIGMELYDVNGNAKDAIDIILELHSKFKDKSSAKAMDELKNKFQGSEGIIALLNAAQDAGGDLFKTLKLFDQGGDGLQKMLTSAKDDINIVNEQVNGKLKSAWVSFGESVLPIWVDIKKGVVDVLDAMNLVKNVDSGDLIKLTSGINTPAQWLAKQNELRGQYMVNMMQANNKANGPGARDIYKEKALGNQAQSQALQDWFNTNPFAKPVTKQTNEPDSPSSANDYITKGLNGVSGGGVRNVTVTFKSLVETFNINTTNLTDSSGKIKTDLEAMLVKVIAGSEQIIGAN